MTKEFSHEDRWQIHAALNVLLRPDITGSVRDLIVRYCNRDANWRRSHRAPPGS